MTEHDHNDYAEYVSPDGRIRLDSDGNGAIAGELRLSNLEVSGAGVLSIRGRDGRDLLTVHGDGTVEGDPGDAGAAAEVFVEWVKTLMPAAHEAPSEPEGGCVPCRVCGGSQDRGWHRHDTSEPEGETVSAALRALADDSQTLWEVARRAIEDELVEWRDSRRFVLRNNGFVVKEKDGTDSSIIRFGPETGVRIALRALADHIDQEANHG